MPTPLAKGVIIAASVLVAAGIAAYESPEFQTWLKNSSQKVAHKIQSLGEDIRSRTHPKPERRQPDPSTQEDVNDVAEERRRLARQEIMARSRTLHDRRKRRKLSDESLRSPSFDSIVDASGHLKSDVAIGTSTAIEMDEVSPTLPERPSRVLEAEQGSGDQAPLIPWESQYELEMRNAWQPNSPDRDSESLIDLTPTTEDFPDPDYSVPSLPQSHSDLRRTEYFSAAASQRSQTLSHTSQPERDQITPFEHAELEHNPFRSESSSIVGVENHDGTVTDDEFSEFGDGIKTPASAWTDVGSVVSDEEHRL